MNWRNDPDLSHMSDMDYSSQMALHLTRAIEADPHNPRPYFLRGNAYLDRDEFDAAIADYSKAIALDPADAVAYNNRGIAYRNKRDPDRAIEDYSKAVEINPGYRDAYNNRALRSPTRGSWRPPSRSTRGQSS